MRFRMRKSAAIMMTVILAVMLFASCSKSGNSELRFGTGGSGGMYYSYAEKLREVSKNSMSFDVRTTAGSSANIRLLDQGFIDIAIVQSDVLLAEGTQACSAIAGLYTEAVQIVTAKGSGIDSVYDLEGKRVSVGEEESGVLVNSKQILEVYGLLLDDIDARYLSFNDAAEALKKGEIDAFFCTAGAPTSAVAKLAESMEIELVGIEGREAETLMKLYGGYSDCVISAGTYKGQNSDVKTIGVKAVLIASNNLDKETVAKLTALIFSKGGDLSAGTPAEGMFNEDYAVLGVPFGFHEGAREYYAGKGIAVAEAESGGTSAVFGGQD